MPYGVWLQNRRIYSTYRLLVFVVFKLLSLDDLFWNLLQCLWRFYAIKGVFLYWLNFANKGGEGEAGHLIFEEKLAKWEGWVTRSCVLVKGPRPQTLNVRVASWSRGLLQLTDDHWKIMTNVELPTTRQNVQLLSELNY